MPASAPAREITIRDATVEDCPFLGRMIHDSGPAINAACFGQRSPEIIAAIARDPRALFSYRNARIALREGVPTGAVVVYPAPFQNRGGLPYLARLFPLLGPLGWARALAKQVLISFALAPKAASDFYLAHIAVEPDRRSSGVGRVLMATAEAMARSRGAARLVLDVELDNERAFAFYRREGFIEATRGRVPFWADRLGTEGFIRMEKAL